MPLGARPLVLALATAVGSAGPGLGQGSKPYTPGVCGAVDAYFADEVWAKLGARSCLTCHKPGGDAEDSKFVLRDPARAQGTEREEAMRHNRDAFARMAARTEKGDKPRLLLKAAGELNHGGEVAAAPGSPEYRVLSGFVARVAGGGKAPPPVATDAKPFFDGVAMLSDRQVLRRVTLSLAGRLPTDAELAAVAKGGRAALPGLFDAVMREDAFYDRVREAFNDIFLTQGIDGNPDQNVLSYEHFEKTRYWVDKYVDALPGDMDKNARQKLKYKVTDDYRKALLQEPMRLIEYVVRNDRPFTELVTGDYAMLSPYTARGYGVFDQVKDRFKTVDDPFEFVPVRLPALKGRSKDQNQDSATGFYPHAGVLGTFQYIVRYPTTETNRNRLRSRMYYQHFLGVDVLELAARVSDAATVQSKFKVPTMEAAECVVCHRTLDPVAGLFQDYWRFAEMGVYGKRKGGWFTDMFAAGFEGEDLPPSERWRALAWLGERTAKDPRFAVAMTEHVYYVLTGRRVLLPPKDLDDPLSPAKQRAYREQRKTTESIAARFAATGFNLKSVFQDWIASDFYRADGPTTALKDPTRRAELDDIGLTRMLAPEQVERKVAAVFGKRWGRLEGEMGKLYGGIDSQEVTERAADPSGAMGAIQRILSNDVACKHVARDFTRPASERVLFPGIEPDVVPGSSPEADAKIRTAIARLHDRILGKADAADVDRTFRLFAGVVADAKAEKGVEKRENYFCRDGTPGDDPHYTVRAWRAVVTYLLRRPEFLYE